MYDSILFEIVKGYSPENRPLWKAKKNIQKVKIVLVPCALRATMTFSHDAGVQAMQPETRIGQLVTTFNWLGGETGFGRMQSGGEIILSWILPLTLAEFLFEKFKEDLHANLFYLDQYIHEKEKNGRTSEGPAGG